LICVVGIFLLSAPTFHNIRKHFPSQIH
jgi:hypothetical protein